MMPLTLVATAAIIGCQNEPSCGDGVVAADEACDDGNVANGDGCSASCAPDDDERTPGDDRAGFFYCATDALAPGVTCPADTLCCLTSGPSCATHEQGCLDPLNVATCDGPEDCGAGNTCWTASHDRACRAEGIHAWCHTDRDCRGVSPWLPDGRCTPVGTCDFAAPR